MNDKTPSPVYSTDQCLGGRFRQHGHSAMHLEGDVLYIETQGPYNLELMAASDLTLRQLLAEQPRALRADIVIVEGSALMAPEVLQAFAQMIARLHQDGLVSQAVALVAGPEVEGISIMHKLAGEAYAAIGVPFCYFERLEQAQHWIANRLLAARQAR